MAYAIIRTAKLKTWGEIGGSLSHTYRTRYTPNADTDRLEQNIHSHKSTQAVKEDIAHRIPEKRRSDAVLCIESLITASPDWDGWGTDKEEAFFKLSREWLEATYGKDNIKAVSIHRDETTPHLIAYIVPLDEDTGRLNAKKWLGGRKKMSAMQTSFALAVESLNLKRGIENSNAHHKTIKKFYSELQPFVKREDLKIENKKLLEDSTKFSERVIDAVYENAQRETLNFRKQISELKNDIRNYRYEVGRLNYELSKCNDYREYVKNHPNEEEKIKIFLKKNNEISQKQDIQIQNFEHKVTNKVVNHKEGREIEKYINNKELVEIESSSGRKKDYESSPELFF